MQEKVYNDAKKEIRSVLMTYPHGVSLDEFLKTYKALLGQRLPSRTLGFTTDLEFLKSLADVLHVSTNLDGKILLTGIANENTEHIQKLVSRQKVTKATSQNQRNAQRSRLPLGLPKGRNLKPFIPGPLRAEMMKIASMYPDGITLPGFVLAYRKKFNKYLSLEKGLDSLECMINSMLELEIRTVKNEKKIFLKAPSGNCMLSPEKQQFQERNLMRGSEGENAQIKKVGENSSFDKSGVPEAIQKNFHTILDKCPEGIPAIHFPPLYEKLIGESFDLLDLGYNSILELVDALPWIFSRSIDPENENNWIILPANSAKSLQNDGKKMGINSLPVGKKTIQLKFRQSEPANVASPAVQFNPPSMPKDLNPNSYIPVFISAVVSPALFWFQLMTPELIDTLDSLEKDLQSFYDDNCDKYKMSDKDVVIGATCVTFSAEDQQWYRAVIKSLPSPNLVNVFFVDYGSRQNVPKSNLCYVRNDFLKYPAQAFNARLAGLKPPKNASSWDTKAQQRLIDLSDSPSLMAYLDLLDSNIYSVYLCDTSQEQDVHINDVLVQEGLAEVISESSSCKFPSSASDQKSQKPLSPPASVPVFNGSLNGNVYIGAKNSSNLESNVTTDDDSLPDKVKQNFSTCREPSDSEAAEGIAKSHQKRYVKRVELCEGDQIHIINFDGNPYVTPGDLSKLFWKERDAKYLEERLKYKEILPPALIITKEDNTELFKQCEWYKLPDLEAESFTLMLYPLDWALKILNVFGHPSVCLRLVIDYQIKMFDPLSAVWNEFEYSDLEEEKIIRKEISENFDKLCLYDLKAKHEVFEIKRLKLLHRNAEEIEMQRLNEQLKIIQKRIDQISSLCSEDLIS